MGMEMPYSIAYDEIDSAINLFIRIHTNSPHVGLGCAAPDELVTGEKIDELLRLMDSEIGPELNGRDPLRCSKILENLKDRLQEWPSGKAAIDMALQDIMGKTAGRRLRFGFWRWSERDWFGLK